jgi:hypothetical protein
MDLMHSKMESIPVTRLSLRRLNCWHSSVKVWHGVLYGQHILVEVDTLTLAIDRTWTNVDALANQKPKISDFH